MPPKTPAYKRAHFAYEILSGKRRGFLAALIRLCLSFCAGLYGFAISLRLLMYKAGILRRKKIPAKVVSVGNITVGGTGKSPMVEYIAGKLLGEGLKAAVVSRGYKAVSVFDKDNNIIEMNDEAMELQDHLPELPQIHGANRAAVMKEYLAKQPADVFVLDDGFQHLRVRRDLDIVLIDCSSPFGFGHLIPRGLMREPLSGLKRADVIVLTRSDSVDENYRRELKNQIQKLAPQALLAEASHKALELENIIDGSRHSPGVLKGKKAILISGIANPLDFEKTVLKLGAKLFYHSKLEDHHIYSAEEVEDICCIPEKLSEQGRVDCVVLPQKDSAKIKRMFHVKSSIPIYGLRVGISFNSGEEEFLRRLKQVCQK